MERKEIYEFLNELHAGLRPSSEFCLFQSKVPGLYKDEDFEGRGVQSTDSAYDAFMTIPVARTHRKKNKKRKEEAKTAEELLLYCLGKMSKYKVSRCP